MMGTCLGANKVGEGCGENEGKIGDILEPPRTYHKNAFVVRVVLEGDVWVFHLGEIGWILLTPHLSKWHGTGLIHFVLTPVLSHLLSLALVFDFVGWRHGGLLVDRLRLLSTHDRRSMVVLQPHPGDDERVHPFWGQSERKSAFSGHGNGE
jgi:hypothetical protein